MLIWKDVMGFGSAIIYCVLYKKKKTVTCGRQIYSTANIKQLHLILNEITYVKYLSYSSPLCLNNLEMYSHRLMVVIIDKILLQGSLSMKNRKVDIFSLKSRDLKGSVIPIAIDTE